MGSAVNRIVRVLERKCFSIPHIKTGGIFLGTLYLLRFNVSLSFDWFIDRIIVKSILYKVYKVMHAVGGCVRLSEYVFCNTIERFPIKFSVDTLDYTFRGNWTSINKI
jgi:hypothetical protein